MPKKEKVKEQKDAFWPIVKWLLLLERPIWPLLGTAVGSRMVSAILGSLATIYTAKFINSALYDHVLFSRPFWIFIIIACLLLPIGIVNFVFERKFGSKASVLLRKRVAQTTVNLRVDKWTKYSTGEYVSRFSSDVESTQNFLQNNLTGSFDMISSLIAGVAALMVLSWQMTILVFLILPLSMFITSRLSKSQYQLELKCGEISDQATKIAQNTLANIETVKAFNLAKEMRGRYREKMTEEENATGKEFWAGTVVNSISTALGFLPLFLSALLGGLLVLGGKLQIGTVIAFSMTVGMVLNPIASIGYIISDFKRNLANVKRVKELIDIPVERDGGECILLADQIEKGQEMLAFDNVMFTYEDKNILFDSLSFSIKEGETVAIVGSSGSGKTSILSLLAGFYSDFEGEVRICGYPISKWDLSAMRKLIGYVEQDTFLFPTTIEENVRLGRIDATNDEVLEAIRAAGLKEFVDSLPDGVNTKVGERGTQLSGGQRQRISIARMFLKNAPILFLDEATSSLDMETEHYIQNELLNLMQGRTSVIIAHRLSGIKNASRILCMQGGRIAESGTHDELIELNGIYAALYRTQTQTVIV